jgi:magnesium chelatase family protein
MLYKTLSAAVYGIDASIIEVEVDVTGIRKSEDHFTTVGLPDAAVRESRERIRSALRNCGYDIPPTDITVNLAPADIKKEGSGYDLPMALGILGAYGGLSHKEVPDYVFVGELSLDGGVRGIRGALPIAVAARAGKIPNLIVPVINAKEAAVVSGVNVYPVTSLVEVVHMLNGGRMVGMRLASMVLPDPGGPIISMLWPPAQATSRARLAVYCPRTSLKSTVNCWASLNSASAY